MGFYKHNQLQKDIKNKIDILLKEIRQFQFIRQNYDDRIQDVGYNELVRKADGLALDLKRTYN
ncbi:MAG: hypothetical protein CSYNP_03135 [Syntrophus sp. SKADARSKE-3]|nr:hypothetical protein [Syntrophus sp. SKADARSKE-3]